MLHDYTGKGKFSKEFLFRECVLHHHCIALHLRNGIQWDNAVVDVIYMIDIVFTDMEQEQLLNNIARGVNTFGILDIKAFSGQESPYEARSISVSTEDIIGTEMV